MQFTASFHITQKPGEAGQVCKMFPRRYWELWNTGLECISFHVTVMCMYSHVQVFFKRASHRSHCCDPEPGAGTRSRGPLTGGSTTSHSSADGPVYSENQADTERVKRRQNIPTPSFCLITTSQTGLLAKNVVVQMHRLWLTQNDAKKPAERASQLKGDCRIFRALIN